MVISAPTLALPDQLTQRVFSRGDVLPPRQDVLWRIECGAIRTVTWSEQGTIISLGYWGKGDIVGHSLSRVKPYQIKCLTSVEISILPSELWYQALDAMLLHLQHVEEFLNIVHQRSVSRRLWQFLVWLGQKFGRDIDVGRLIDLGVTHQEMAEVVNTTRVTVTRILQQFESEGIVLRHQRRLVLCSPTQPIK